MKFAASMIGLLLAAPANAEPALEDGFAGAIRGCEEWVLNPASWVDGFGPFSETVGLGDRMGLAKSAAEEQLPPPDMRVANHYWRINSTSTAGYMLVVSDRLPMCHITGGGDADLQPVVEQVLTSEAFLGRWEKVEQKAQSDMISSQYRNREEPALFMIISRANAPDQRRDLVQILATAIFEFD
ncbi:MAG: hypothetical protein H6918_07165 [Sphingomonadaceae bacterium]|nr:hypothetical protein [Sphingomonadaceae bacterium]